MVITQQKPLRIATSGFLISLIGALPLGTLNLTTFEIAATQGTSSALSFASGVVFVELVVVSLMLVTANKMVIKQSFYKYIFPIAIGFLLYLAFTNFYQFSNPDGMSKTTAMFNGVQSPLLLGILLSALNPLQFPYWFGWNTAMVQRKKLDGTPSTQVPYIIGIGAGTRRYLTTTT